MPSNWDRVIGQTRIKGILRSAVSGGRVAHAYLLWGNAGVGKDALAIEVARVLLCARGGDEACGTCSSCRKMDSLQHPNLHLIFPLPGSDAKKSAGDDDGQPDTEVVDEIRRQTAEKAKDPYFHIDIPKAKFIRIPSIRDIRKQSSMSGAEQGKRIFVIFDAEAMNDEAANSLLKVLEEPLEGVHFLLVTSRKDAMKQTILSRCQLLQCATLTDKEIAAALMERQRMSEQEAAMVARLANGSYTRAVELISSEITQFRTDVAPFLRSILGASQIKLMEEQEEYLTGNKRDRAEQLLAMILVWFRDAVMLREGGRHHLFNADQEEDLVRFTGRFGTKDLEACMDAAERALELLRRNVYLPLVMLSLIVQLRRILHAK
ncbi:MAG: DNA polymerase III subunit [Bacteroidetes bacterium]|nr:DNA polymerase III subunit [Bacteroidota bacterium]